MKCTVITRSASPPPLLLFLFSVCKQNFQIISTNYYVSNVENWRWEPILHFPILIWERLAEARMYCHADGKAENVAYFVYLSALWQENEFAAAFAMHTKRCVRGCSYLSKSVIAVRISKSPRKNCFHLFSVFETLIHISRRIVHRIGTF